MAKKEDAKKKTVAKKAPVKKMAVKKAAPAKKPTTKKTTPTAVAKKAAVKKVPIKATPKKTTTKKVAVTKKTAEKVAKKATSTKAKKKVSGSLDKELESEASQDELTDSSEKMVSEELSDEEKRKQKRKNKLEKKIQKLGSDANRSLSKYLQEISKYDPLLPEREVELAIRIQNNDELAMKELVEANLRFVVSVAKKYQGNGLSLADIINEGNLGLIKAAKRFDHTRGFKFISYAVWWIRQSILQALAEQSRLIRLPLNRVGTITKITRAAEKLEAEIERQPKGDEIGTQLEMGGDEVYQALQYSRRHSSLNSPFQEGENSSLLDIIEDTQEAPPETQIMRESMTEEVISSLDTLADRERAVLEMYFGINRDSAMTLNEIGEEFDLTRERVRQIKEKAIQRLRHRSRSKSLRRYLG